MFDFPAEFDVAHNPEINVEVPVAASLRNSHSTAGGFEVVMIANDACFVEFSDYRSDGSVPFHWPVVISIVAVPVSIMIFEEPFGLIFVAGVRSPARDLVGTFCLLEKQGIFVQVTVLGLDKFRIEEQAYHSTGIADICNDAAITVGMYIQELEGLNPREMGV